MLDEYLEEEEEEEQQQSASAEVAIKNNGHCSAICVLAAKERAQCARCDVGLCEVPCFTECHTKVNL
jgi:hypothetical protein